MLPTHTTTKTIKSPIIAGSKSNMKLHVIGFDLIPVRIRGQLFVHLYKGCEANIRQGKQSP